MLSDEQEEYLGRIYYGVGGPGSFSGIQKLWDVVRKDRNKPVGIRYVDVVEFLKKQDTYVTYVSPRRKFDREQIVVERLYEQFDVDLLDMQGLAKDNDGVKFLLVVIDIFSRYLCVRPLKSKRGEEVVVAMKDVFDEEMKCEVLRSDLGSEFMFKGFQKLLKDYGIYHIKAYNESKACFAERVNQSIEGKIYRFLYANNSLRYIDVLNDIVQSYNQSVHSAIGQAPASVNEDNAMDLYERVYRPVVDARASKNVEFKFEIGDYVRLSHAKKVFDRSYGHHWSIEVFRVVNRIASFPPRYKIEDLMGEVIQGSFYGPELMKSAYDASAKFKVEKVIRYKRERGQKLAYVKWLGWNEKFNSWVPIGDIV